jgi:peptidoglycan/xylan/chitin deacetylase (PgdA/CDA1 family)
MGRLLRARSQPLATLESLHAVAPTRPIVVIESDDWGRTGLPSLAAMELLKAAGSPIGESPWDFYGLESEDDVIRLGDMLSEICDSDGNPACITANFIMANADLARMRDENFETFHALPITSGFPPPGDSTLLPAYRRNVAARVFHPGLHGFTHFNVSALMKLLKEESIRGDQMRQLAYYGVPYLASLTPECNFALVERRNGDELFLSEPEQASWIEAGVKLFEEAFGRRPTTVCAPGYRANEATFRVWRRHGFESAQFNGKRGVALLDGMTLLERNVSLEPALHKTQGAAAAIAAAGRAVRCGFPIVICSHSINYMSHFFGYASEGRRELGELLHGLLKTFPNLRFASDADIVSAWKTNDPGWFRRPTMREVAARLRVSMSGNADG